MNWKLRCMVIDDEPLAVELMESYVRKTPFLELVGSCGSGTAAFAALRRQPVDLLFCDIQMPGLSGMELSRMLPEQTRIVFTTAFPQYAVEGFRVQAMDYLLKPISYNDFLTAANKALAWFDLKRRAEQPLHSGAESPAGASGLSAAAGTESGGNASQRVGTAAPAGTGETAGAAGESPAAQRGEGGVQGGAQESSQRTVQRGAAQGVGPAGKAGDDLRQSLFVKTEYRLQQIPLERILYIEGLKDYVKIHVEGEAHPVVSLLSLKSLEEQLPADRFIRVHRSYIVQPSKIHTIERNRILFDRERIPISENYRQPFYDFLARHALLPGGVPGKE